jgi:alkyl hydroperoxide reductase subunit AhpF
MKRRDFLRLGGLGAAVSLAPREIFAAAKSGAVQEPARDVPIAGAADVVVCGAGPAGVAAAVEAARKGAKTRLIELHGCLGGIWTAVGFSTTRTRAA